MFSKYSVKKPYTVVVCVVLVLILGIVSFTNMTADLLPDMSLPYAIVMTTYQGASPQEVESAVTKPIEQAMATTSNIKNVSSTSQENASTVILEFEQTANMDSVTIEMREKLDQIKGYWPDTVGNPIIMKLNPDMMPVMVAAVTLKDSDAVSTSMTVENDVLPEIESVEGVASVTTTGNIEQSIEINLSDSKIQETNTRVQNALNGKFSDAKNQIAEAKDKVEAGESQLKSGSDALAKQSEKVSDKEAELLKAENKINTALDQLEAGQKQIDQATTTLAAAKKEAIAQAIAAADKAAMENAVYQQLEAAKNAAQEALKVAPDDATKEKLKEQIQTLNGQMTEILSKAEEGAKEQVEKQFAKQESTLASKQKQITSAKTSLEKTKKQLLAGKITLTQAKGKLESASISATIQMATAQSQLDATKTQLEQSEKEIKETQKQAKKSADVSKMVTKDMVKQLLTAENFDMPAGYITMDHQKYLLRVGDDFENIDDIKNMPLFDMDIDGLDTIKLSDVADVSFTNNAADTYAKVNGQSGVLFTVQKQTGYSTGDVSKRLLDKFESLKKENPDLSTLTLMDQGMYIDVVVNSVLQNMILGGILAILILFVFLRDLRPTFVIACSIPISIVTAIVLMYFSGVTINIISLSGLALGVGMLVDNSIVVIENIFRMRNEEGASTKTAAIEGARQVSGAIAASTLTTVCVFAPIVFTKGITRQLFVEMGLTIAYSLLASLLVALTVVPMISAGLLKKRAKNDTKLFVKIKTVYGKLLEKALSHKVLVLLGTLALLILSGALAISKGTEYMPTMESTQISLTVETDKDSTVEETGKIADQVVDKLNHIKDIQDVGALLGSGNMMSTGTTQTNQVQMYCLLNENRSLSNEKLQKEIENAVKDLDCTVDVSMSNMDMSALGSSGLVVQIKGKDLDKLQSISKDISKIVGDVKGTKNVSNGLENADKELRIVVNKEKAIAQNLTVAQVYQALSGQFATPTSASTLDTDTKGYDIYIYNEQQKKNLSKEDLQNFVITATKTDGTTKNVKLSKVADITEGTGLPSISRDAQSRYMNVTSEIEESDNIGLVSNRVQKALNQYQVPDGYEVTMQGEDETIRESMIELLKMLGLAVVFMYLIMVAQFQSLRSPFIIMFTIPLAFTGGFFGLYLSNKPVSIIAMIGFVMLSGIIVNNGIVFVDYTNQLIRGGMEQKAALVEAGKTRLRPIVMTALTTIFGLSTMALGIGMGADMVQPMAIVTIGGLVYGTVLTLFVVPCIYHLFHKRERARLTQSIEEEKTDD